MSPVAHEKRTLDERLVIVLEIRPAKPQYLVQFRVMFLFYLGQHKGKTLRNKELLSPEPPDFYIMK
jgi:hypothetical protein